MLSENLLIDLTWEIGQFMRLAAAPFQPVFNLQEVLDNVFSSVNIAACAEENLKDYALCFAFDVAYSEVRIEEGEVPEYGPTRNRFEAVMQLGFGIYTRLRDMRAYLEPDGFFPYVFAEVYSDHLVRLVKIPFEESGPLSALPLLFGAGYQL